MGAEGGGRVINSRPEMNFNEGQSLTEAQMGFEVALNCRHQLLCFSLHFSTCCEICSHLSHF